MKYTKAIDVWKLTQEERKQLQIGQWVYAGSPDNKGVWCGQRANGVDVTAWYGNAKGRVSYRGYVRQLMQYARG